MRPLRKYPNGGDIKDSGELPQINLTASRANWEKQKELRKQLAQTQQDYNNLINDYGLKADDQAQFGFQDYQGGMSSTEELQAKINKLNESYKNVTDQFASANRALADLRTAYPDEWNNKTVSDVITPAGLAAMRKLKIENNAYDNSLRDYYANYGSLVDPNTQYGYGPGATYSAKQAKENWMEDVPDFVSKVNTLATAAPLLGAGAIAGPTAGAILQNPLVQAGLTGYGLYDATTNTIPEAYRDFSQGRYWEGAGNTALAALDLMPGAVFGDFKRAGKYLNKGYNKVATGNSRLTDLGLPAWKVEDFAEEVPLLKNQYNLTDEEAKVINDYIANPYDIKNSPEKSALFDKIVKEKQVNLSNINNPITRIENYYVSQHGREAIPTTYGSTFSFPRSRSWSVGSNAQKGNERTRLVIPSRYAKELNQNFHAVDYTDPRLPEALSRTTEQELIGNVPEGFKVIGTSNQGGFKNVIIKPVKSTTSNNTNSQINFSNSSKVAPWNVYSSPEEVREKLQQSRDFIKTEGEKELADFASEEGLRRARLAFKKTNPKLTDDEIDSLVADQMTELQNAINYNLPEYALKNPDIWKNFNIDNTNKFWLETNFPNNNAFAWDNPSFYEEMTNLEGIPTYSNPNLINMDISELGSFKGLPSSMQKSLLDSQQEFTRPYFRIPTISIGPKHIGKVPTMAHEVGHLLQRSGLHPTDLELQKLVNKEGITPSALIQKTWNQLFKLSPQYNNSFKYFYAPKGRVIPDEGYAFARETRQAMLDKGIIKDKFEKITPSKILQYRLSQPFSMQEGQRLTTIVPPWKWKGLSKIMNDMNVVIPGAVGTGAIGYGLSNSQNNNKTYKSGGSLAPNIPTYYNFRGTPIYRDTTALPFASGGMLDGPPDNPVLPSLKNLNTNEVSALLYNTVANIIERKKAEGKIKPGENLDLRGVVAQILLESGNARSGLTAKYNNFGGLRATQGFIDRGGKTVAMVNKATGKKFLWRAYDTPEQGLEAQIDFLLDNPRYRKAGVFNAKNTQEYLAAVSKAGYAGGEPTYARKVNQMARSLDKRLKKVTPEKLQELNQTYNVSPTLQPIGVNTTAPINQAAVTPQVQAPVIDPAILAMRENLAIPAKSSIDLLKEPISQLEEMPSMGPELNPPSFVPDEEYYMSGLPTPKFKSRVVPFMGKGASNYQTSGGLRLPYISGWNQNQFINPVAARVQQQTDYDPDYYYGTDQTPGEYEKASLENRPINFEGGFASKKMQRDAEQYLQEYDQYNQFLQDSENYGNLMLGRQFKYGSNLYERQGLIPSMYASSLGRYYGNGGKFITAGGEYHKVYKNAEGDIIVNHPKEDKGQWDTINLTDKANAKTVSQGVAATKKWHRENPNTYSNGGKINYSMYDVFQHGTYANGGMIKRADGSYSKRGLWDNIRANAGSGKKPTKEMLAQERKINNQKANGGYLSSFKASNIQTY